MTLLEQAKAVKPKCRRPKFADPQREELYLALLSGEISISAARVVLGEKTTGNIYASAATTLMRLIREGRYEIRRIDNPNEEANL